MLKDIIGKKMVSVTRRYGSGENDLIEFIADTGEVYHRYGSSNGYYSECIDFIKIKD